MKKIYYSALFLGVIGLTAYADQYLKVTPKQGEPVYYTANKEAITFTEGQTVTIQGTSFNLSELTSIEVVSSKPSEGVPDSSLDDNLVLVVYEGYTANVRVAENISDYINVAVDGAHVTIEQGAEVGTATDEITYRLQGDSGNGSFVLSGDYKCSIELNGLTLTNPSGGVIEVNNGKRIAVRVTEDTENTLTDGSAGTQKACLYAKGHLEFKQKGILNITGNKAHAISCKEYIQLKNATININGSVKDGVNCGQYFLMESGSLNITNPGDDGIQVSYKDDTNREAEDTGTFTMEKGTITIRSIIGEAAKGIKADNDVEISGGTVTILSNAPGIWDSEKSKTKASACVSADGNITIAGGTFDLIATGAGGKCISCDGTFHSTGGKVTGSTTGGALVYRNGTLYQGNYGSSNLDNIASDYKSSPKAIKADTEAILEGGEFDLSTKGTNGEGIESKGDLTFAGEVVVKVRAYDDATNSSKNTYVKGGTLDLGSTGQGDGIDANANIYISGGKTIVCSSSVGSEQGLDSGDGSYSTYITGGSILSYGSGGNGKISSTTNSQAFINPSTTLSVGAVVEVKNTNGDLLGSFTIPTEFTTGSTGGGGMGGNRPGGSGNSSNILISVPGMVSGTSYTVSVNGSSTTATAQTSGGSSGPGGR